MTSGRLTLTDRREIAAGVSEGLSFAEIGRRVGRPTSTISREVARNGHNLYSAENAHDSAKRRPRALHPPEYPHELHDERRTFAEEFSSLLTATGMPRTAARVFTVVLTSDAGARTAAELVRELRVSPAAVSRAVRYLEEMRLLTRRPDRGRREIYSIDEDVWLHALQSDSTAHARVAAASARGTAVFGGQSSAGRRLLAMSDFFSGLTEQMRGGDLTDTDTRDAKTVLAALIHTGTALTSEDIALGMGWPATRAATALDRLVSRPALADPFIVQRVGESHTAELRVDRLSPQQQAALHCPRSLGAGSEARVHS
ncbi:GbsR/MarR family transcriptional regulator [Microbacterium sp. LWH12-1.2]|uniref:GbsR/MarR family transcriptional regulator n=1 Tax=Microbacterium sp. LWH12-1.2 TaxID=3135259 RepID=UPI003418AC7C